MRAFYCRWLKTAFTHSFAIVGQYDLWVGLISSMLTLIDHYVPALRLVELHGWQIPLYVLAVVVGLRLVAAPYWMWKEDQAKRSTVSTAGIFPDWTIREMFYALDSKVLDDSNWIAVGQAIKDNLAIDGRLQCWGRPSKNDWIETLVGELGMAALRPIPCDYWHHADFTYLFLAEDHQYVPHVRSNLHSDDRLFTDLQVNKTQAMSLDWSAIEKFKSQIALKMQEASD